MGTTEGNNQTAKEQLGYQKIVKKKKQSKKRMNEKLMELIRKYNNKL